MTTSPRSLPTTSEIQGREVAFPIEVRLARMANAVYTVPAEAVEGLVPRPFEVAADVHGAATVVVGFVDYEDNDLGDYDEVLLSVMARSAAGEEPVEGSYIWRLPVNQDFTREAGVRMLGLPKTLEDIDIVRDAHFVTCTLRADGQLVLRQTFPLLTGVDPVPMPSPTVCLSIVDGVPAVSESETRGGLRMSFAADGYELELGDHAWADELRSAVLGSTPPTVITVCDDWWSTFHPPDPLEKTSLRHG